MSQAPKDSGRYEWSLSDVVNVTNFTLGKSRTFFVNGGIRFSF